MRSLDFPARLPVIFGMLFPSNIFLFLFLPVFLAVYYLSRGRRLLVLTVFSYIFYGWWDWRFLFLIAFSTTVDWICGDRIAAADRPGRRKLYLLVSIVTNLSLLAFFKYFMFGAENIAAIGTALGLAVPGGLTALTIVLPVGISFYTFQSMSYTIDIYRGDAKPTRGFIDFAAYVSMFPQLVAGPIVRYSHMESQLRNPVFTSDRIYLGIQFFIIGLAEKVLIADTASLLGDAAFGAVAATALTAPDAVLGVLAYAVQIYFDFAGYSNMAVGLGYLCGFAFPMNFNSPYLAVSFSDFWRRWHISLSSWLRDYLYIPLGGSRSKTYRNLVLTMLLGGLWHGASWNFVIWGGYHGMLLAVERALGDRNPLRRLPQRIQSLVVFGAVCAGWVFFRAEKLPSALGMFQAMGNWSGGLTLLPAEDVRFGLLATVLGLVIAFFLPNSWQIGRNASWPKTCLLILLALLSVVFILGTSEHPFLYYQF